MKIKLLIIDDSEADSNLLIRYLRKIENLDIETICASTSSEGIAIWKENKPEIIIIDYLLGAENGIEIIKKFKEIGCRSEFVLLTGYGNEDVVTEALRVGASDYISKSNLNTKVLERVVWQLSQKIETDLKIKKTESKLGYILEKTSTGLVILNETGLIINANDSFIKMLGLASAENINNKNIIDLVCNSSKNLINSSIENCKVDKSFTDLEINIEKPNGQISYLLLSALYENDNGKNTIFVICRDITERKIYEQELKEAKRKAEESDKLKSSFLANMSHEIRTPMNAIVGFSDLMGRKNLNQEDKEKYIEIIKSSSNTLLNIINDIIDLSKIEIGQISLSKQDFNVNVLMIELYSTYTSFVNKDVELVCKNMDAAEHLKINSDPYRIKQVLVNLLDNAFKFTSNGQVEFGFIKTETQEILFFVKDTGIGIPKDKQDIIFDRFRKLEEDTSKLHRGTGLGLAISKKLVHLLNGNIWVESEPGNGSAFYFTVQQNKPIELQPNKFNVKQITPHSTLPDWSKKSILIVEDEENNYFYIVNLLKESNAKIIWAKTGKESVDIISSGIEMDIILMDIKLPEMDGVTAIKIIREINPNIPIIAQTAFAMKGDDEEFIKAGCDDYISKPINLDDFIEKISHYLLKP